MFETETTAELYVKQGLLAKALDLYNRLLTSAEDEITRARRRQRIGEVEQLLATGSPTPTPLPATPATSTKAAPPLRPRSAPAASPRAAGDTSRAHDRNCRGARGCRRAGA